MRVPYSFQNFNDVPTEYMSDSQVARAIKMDKIIPVARSIQATYNMGNVVDEVVRRNQDAIDLINSSMTDDDLYPQANNFQGDDGDYLDQLHEMMDQAGDQAHDADWPNKPSFANNTPENNWRDLRSLADSVFDAGEMEEIVRRKRNNNRVDHNLRSIQDSVNSVAYINVSLVSDKQNDEDDMSPGPDNSNDGLDRTQKLILGATALGIVVLLRT